MASPSPDLVLASQSRIRSQILTDAGVPHRVEPAKIDENSIKTALMVEKAPARDIADTLADMKARKISARHPGSLVLGADQILVYKDRIYDKPDSLEDARAHLVALRGHTHHLLSAAVIYLNAEPLFRHIGTARLTMRPVSDAFLDHYISHVGDDLLTTVGAYQLEGMGSQLFSRVDGDYFSVLGLPLLEVLGFLRARGMLIE